MIKVKARADAIGVRRAVPAASAVGVDTSETGGGADVSKPKMHALLSKSPVGTIFQ